MPGNEKEYTAGAGRSLSPSGPRLGCGRDERNARKGGTSVTKGYQSYRGRRDRGHKLLIVLLALVLLAACAYLLAQRYITYTDDGGMRLDLPFFSQGEDPAGGDGGPDAAPAGGETERSPRETGTALERFPAPGPEGLPLHVNF